MYSKILIGCLSTDLSLYSTYFILANEWSHPWEGVFYRNYKSLFPRFVEYCKTYKKYEDNSLWQDLGVDLSKWYNYPNYHLQFFLTFHANIIPLLHCLLTLFSFLNYHHQLLVRSTHLQTVSVIRVLIFFYYFFELVSLTTFQIIMLFL